MRLVILVTLLLSISAAPVNSELVIQLREGENFISINVIPPVEMFNEDENRGPDVRLMFEQIRDQIISVRQSNGNFWAPRWGYCAIAFWNLTQSYVIEVNEDVEFVIDGAQIAANADVPLTEGENWIAYYPDYELDASAPDFYVLSPIIDLVESAMDGEGREMRPNDNFSNMEPWRQGQGYIVNVTEDVVLNYPEDISVRHLNLHLGWNTVSVNVQPDDHEDILALMAPLVERNLLTLIKNSDGEFYRPDRRFNNIPGWFVDEGYMMLVSRGCVLTLQGEPVAPDQSIQLEEGWQIVSYYPRDPIEATAALSNIEDHLITAKDGRGNFYLPDWDFSNMGDMREGQGYYLNVDADCELVYQIDNDRVAFGWNDDKTIPEYLPLHAITSENMSLLVLVDTPTSRFGGRIGEAPTPLCGGGAVGVYASGQLVGSGVLRNGACGIAVWGDDPTTGEIDGALKDQELELRLVDENGVIPATWETLTGSSIYQTDSYWVVKLNPEVKPPSEFGIVSIYPNPFNSSTRLSYSLSEPSPVTILVFDLRGNLVETLVNRHKTMGHHSTTWNGSELASGVYIVKFEARGTVNVRKVVLMR